MFDHVSQFSPHNRASCYWGSAQIFKLSGYDGIIVDEHAAVVGIEKIHDSSKYRLATCLADFFQESREVVTSPSGGIL